MGTALCGEWTLVLAACGGFAGGLLLGIRIAGGANIARLLNWRTQRLARREDANGRALLLVAQEMEMHAAELHRLGLPSHAPHRWAQACRRAAADHLACINHLMLCAAPGGAPDWKDPIR
jgi:hypothetical protein